MSEKKDANDCVRGGPVFPREMEVGCPHCGNDLFGLEIAVIRHIASCREKKLLSEGRDSK